MNENDKKLTQPKLDPRMSQFLPTIKCGDCGQDVQLRQLGEHVCSKAPAVPKLNSPYSKERHFG